MQVTCESFWYEIRSGEEEDVYFEIEFKEYRSYGARRLNALDANPTLASKLKELLSVAENATLPVLVEVPRPARGRNGKELTGNIFKVVVGYQTLVSITKKYTGGTAKWKDLFDKNKDTNVFGECADTGAELPLGTEIKIPSSWSDD